MTFRTERVNGGDTVTFDGFGGVNVIGSHLAQLAYEWAIRSFGYNHVHDNKVRALRALEEMIELNQALGVPEEQAAKCVQVIYARPKGDYAQEIGGVMLTTYVLSCAMHEDADELFVRELSRVLAKTPETFLKKNQEKIDAGLTGYDEGMRGT